MMLVVLVYLTYAVLFAFTTICLAAGLYYLAELVEEYAFFTKKIIKYAIWVILLIHVLIWLTVSEIGTLEICIGLVAHVVYSSLLPKFPTVELLGPRFLLSVVMVITNHLSWFFYFRDHYFSFPQIMSIFLLLVWIIPFTFFISLSANENTLPYGNPSIATASGDYLHSKRGRSVNVLRSIFGLLRRKTETILPSLRDSHSMQSQKAL
eukprot:TRINITY_DN1344_c0_g1_i1.p1 TRINITY_DN1344_c0_g1~~TRINITY_DN1344_c0_g1_i1.p1  ORF type:complete len:208 (-),score=21.15 TRINITY_DN1344_c0_g1_i1:43-666(-)